MERNITCISLDSDKKFLQQAISNYEAVHGTLVVEAKDSRTVRSGCSGDCYGSCEGTVSCVCGGSCSGTCVGSTK